MIRSTFALPMVIAGASLVGLVVALAGEGWYDVASWMALAVPVAATGWAMRVRRP